MKEVEYEELDLKGDEQVFHMWEPLNFEIKDDYKYIIDNKILNCFSDLLFIIITPILWILNKVMFGFEVEGVENLRKVSGGKITISNHVHPMDCTMNGLINFPERTYFPTLATNFKIPFIRHLIRILYAIPIPKKQEQKEPPIKDQDEQSKQASEMVRNSILKGFKEANKVFDEIEKSKKDIPEIFQKEKIIEIIK